MEVSSAGATDGAEVEDGPEDHVNLDELCGASLAEGWWRRSLCDFRGRYLARVVVRLRPPAGSVVVAQTSRAKGWHGGDPMTTGGTVWDSSLLLATHLQEHPHLVAGQSVVELGAGTGLSGLVAKRLGAAEVVLTDLPPMLPILEANVHRNFPPGGGVSARPLAWQDAADAPLLRGAVFGGGAPRGGGGHSFDLALLSDVLYHAEQREPLLAALVALAARKGTPGPLVCYWAQELHQGEHWEWLRSQLEASGWRARALQSVDDGVGLELVLLELVAPSAALSATPSAAPVAAPSAAAAGIAPEALPPVPSPLDVPMPADAPAVRETTAATATAATAVADAGDSAAPTRRHGKRRVKSERNTTCV